MEMESEGDPKVMELKQEEVTSDGQSELLNIVPIEFNSEQGLTTVYTTNTDGNLEINTLHINQDGRQEITIETADGYVPIIFFFVTISPLVVIYGRAS